MPVTTISGRAETASTPDQVHVWDLPIRAFHWITVVGVLVTFLTGEWRDLHTTAGYVVMGALLVRITWGFVGSRHARFVDFVPRPGKLLKYGNSIVQGKDSRYPGHNPAGGAMVMVLVLTLALMSITGWMMSLDQFWGEDWVENTHSMLSDFLLVLIPLHIGGVFWSSYRHRENLVKAMVTGNKAKTVDE